MSQSPVNDFSSQSTVRYQQGWRALNRLLHESRSFSGRERHCLFLNCGIDESGDLKRFADVSSVTEFDLLDDGRGIAVSDWDFDGDLDLWTTNRTAPRVRFLRNDGESGNHFLAVKLAGDGKSVNRDAIGARVELYRTSNDSTPMIQTVRAGESFLSQSSAWVHFGLGTETDVDRMVVRWPGGDVEEIRELTADQFHLISHGSRRAVRWNPPTRTADLNVATIELPADSEQARIVVPAGLPMPDILTVDAAGRESVWVPDSKGPMLINLWASWCLPCVEELKQFSQAADQIRKAGIEVVALNTEALGESNENSSLADELLKKIGFPFVSIPVSDNTVQALNAVQQAVLDRWKPLPLPSSFLVDGKGEVVVIYKGPVSPEQLLADQALLTASPEVRRAAGTPFSGRWVDEKASRSSPRRVANQLLDQNQIGAAMRYLNQIVSSVDGAVDGLGDGNARRELGDNFYFLGVLHSLQRQSKEARAALSSARELLPDDVRVRGDLGKLLLKMGEYQEAATELKAAVAISPNDLELGQHLGVTLVQLNRLEEASVVLQAVVDENPSNGTAWYFLANAQLGLNQFGDAIAAYRKAIDASPHLLDAANNLSWILSVHPDARLRSGEEALALAKRLCEVTRFKESRFLDTLAVAYAETGQFENAVETARKAIEVSRETSSGESTKSAEKSLQNHLRMFENQKPYRETTWGGAPGDASN